MQWFYGQTDLLYVNSEFYRRCWIDRGIVPDKLRIFPRGLDTELFNPARREADFWKARGAKGAVMLYVGRVSKEKDLNFLAEIMPALRARVTAPFTLAIVGEGPYRQELEALLPDAIFTGILTGRELGVAYASADLFVFPSTTDTYGNVVVEAMAAGLPVAVSDIGGPRELVKTSQMGRVLPARDAAAWVDGPRGDAGQAASGGGAPGHRAPGRWRAPVGQRLRQVLGGRAGLALVRVVRATLLPGRAKRAGSDAILVMLRYGHPNLGAPVGFSSLAAGAGRASAQSGAPRRAAHTSTAPASSRHSAGRGNHPPAQNRRQNSAPSSCRSPRTR